MTHVYCFFFGRAFLTNRNIKRPCQVKPVKAHHPHCIQQFDNSLPKRVLWTAESPFSYSHSGSFTMLCSSFSPFLLSPVPSASWLLSFFSLRLEGQKWCKSHASIMKEWPKQITKSHSLGTPARIYFCRARLLCHLAISCFGKYLIFPNIFFSACSLLGFDTFDLAWLLISILLAILFYLFWFQRASFWQNFSLDFAAHLSIHFCSFHF